MSDSGKVLIYVNIPELFIRVYPFVFYSVPLDASCQYPEAAVGRSTGSSATLTPLLQGPFPLKGCLPAKSSQSYAWEFDTLFCAP
jgi:hypothetical protein